MRNNVSLNVRRYPADGGAPAVSAQFFSGRSAQLEVPECAFFKINHGETGFFRVRLSAGKIFHG
jgi:hypothetical protein